MGTTVIGPVLKKYPAAATPALVYLKRNWSDDWTFVPELEFVEAAATTAAHGLGDCTLLHRYGVLKNPWQSGSGPQQPASIDGCWVRIMLAGQQGMQQAWVGRISSETRAVYGSSQQSSGPTPAGQQRFQALAPLDILRKIDVSRSFWIINNEDPVVLDWLAPLNEKYGRTDKPNATKGKALGAGPGAKALGSRSGNRSQNPDSNGVYAYGDYELWDYQQFAKYLLANFVDESATGGPAWTLGGQCDLLANYADPIEFGVTQTVEQILRRLVRPDYGLDYVIVPTDAGFEVSVFVLTKQSCGWGGLSLPGNPNTVKIYAGQTKDSVKTVVEKTSAEKYGTIRVLGGRIVCCGSFVTGLRLPNGSLFPGWPTTIGIEPSWNDQDQADYDAGTGNPADDASLQDEARRQERFNERLSKVLCARFLV